MRLYEFASLSDYKMLNTKPSDRLKQTEKVCSDNLPDAVRNLTETVDIKKPRLFDTL
jgi:hypothetical protein